MKDGKDAAIVNGTSESEHKSKSTQNRPGPKAQQQSVNQKVRNQNRQQTKIKSSYRCWNSWCSWCCWCSRNIQTSS